MFFARRPSTPDIERYLLDSQPLPLSYDPQTAGARKGEYDVDDSTTTIGHGRADLACARDAIAAWDHFALGWTEIFPRSASLAPGTVVAVLFYHL